MGIGTRKCRCRRCRYVFFENVYLYIQRSRARASSYREILTFSENSRDYCTYMLLLRASVRMCVCVFSFPNKRRSRGTRESIFLRESLQKQKEKKTIRAGATDYYILNDCFRSGLHVSLVLSSPTPRVSRCRFGIVKCIRYNCYRMHT